MGRHNYLDDATVTELLGIDRTSPVMIYACASTRELVEDQLSKMRLFCKERGYVEVKETFDVGSTVDDLRAALLETLASGGFSRLVVSSPDSLARVGYPYIEALLKSQNIPLEIAC